MCGRFTNSKDPNDIAKRFEAVLGGLPDVLPRFNIAPRHVVLAIRHEPESGHREVVPLRWGFIPSWAKDSTIGNRLMNARGETVNQKPAFKSAFMQRRCLVPADGFFEWRKRKDRGFEHRKCPYYIRFQDGRLFGFAGLWESWKDHNGKGVETCTIITTTPNEIVKPIHERMPVIIEEHNYEEWLNAGPAQRGSLQNMLRPFPPHEMEALPVGSWVNNPTVDDRKCVEPIEEAE